jgi:hypothetical protein
MTLPCQQYPPLLRVSTRSPPSPRLAIACFQHPRLHRLCQRKRSKPLLRLTLTETSLSIHYFGTQQRDITRARALPVWTHPNGTISLCPRRPTRQHMAFTGDILSADLPDFLLVAGLSLSATHTLRTHSRQALHHLRDKLIVHT